MADRARFDILVVEDEPLSAMMLEELLVEARNCKVHIASTGKQAIELAKEIMPLVILMDINLAGDMDGIEAASEIVEEHNMPIIFITGYDEDSIKNRALKLDPLAYFIKPVDIDELLRHIDSI